jgi:hypothetical protein
VSLEMRPGAFTAVFEALARQGEAKGPRALTALANVIERQAKINVSTGAHAYGTPTPARPGTGPAVISGNLRRSLTHTPLKLVGPSIWETRVGTGVGFYPGYGKNRTPANKYGYYLEKAPRYGAPFPFLEPAFRYAVGAPARVIYESVYGERSWKRVA